MADRVLIFAPRGRDAEIAADLLSKNGIGTDICASPDALLDQAHADVGAILLTEEALSPDYAAALAEWVASQSSWSDIPFIVLSGDRDIAEKAKGCGANDHLGKPFEFDDLLRLVKKYAKTESNHPN